MRAVVHRKGRIGGAETHAPALRRAALGNPAADNAATYADGSYTASAQGCVSEVSVTVTITGGKVTNVAIDASGETPDLGGKAAESLAPALVEAGGTAGVDAVTGSTMTSDAVFEAMDDCLAQAAQ